MSDLPYAYQEQLFAQKRRTLAEIEQGRNLTPDVAARVADIAKTWRDLKPGVIVSLARAGYTSASPEAKQLAQVATQQASTMRQWQQRLNQVNTLADLKTGITDQQFHDLPPALQHAYAHRASQLAQENVDKQPGGGFMNALNYVPAVGAVKGIVEGASPTEILTRIVPGAKPTMQLEGMALNTAGQAPGVGQPLRTAVRTAAIGMQTPLDILNASIRQGVLNAAQGKVSLAQMNTGDITQSLSQVGQQTVAEQSLVKGLSTGSGFLPDPSSPAAQAAAQAARQYSPYTIGGHAFTPGRALADLIFEPNTEPFNIMSGLVDATNAIKFDPTAIGFGLAGDIRQAGKEFIPELNGAGVYPTTGPVGIMGTDKTNWLASDKFANGVGQILADTTSPSEIKRMFPTLPITTANGAPLADQLSKAGTVDDVRGILSDATELTGPLSMPGVSYKVRRALDSRLFAAFPAGTIADPTDKNINWKVFDDIMRGANVDLTTRNRVLDNYIRNDNVLSTVDGATNAMAESMIAHGTPADDAYRRASFFKDAHYRTTAYDIDQMTGHERLRPGVGIIGDGYVDPAPSLSSEQFQGPLRIPDGREIRRASSEFSFITGTKPWSYGQTALAAPAAVWKPLQVLTARMAVRIFGETQLLLAARGLDNAFTHPLRYISLLMGDHPDAGFTKFLDKIPGLDPTYLYGLDGLTARAYSDDLLMHSSTFIHGPDTVATRGFLAVPVNHPDAPAGYAEMLGRAAADPIVQGVAKAETPDAAKEWFWDGPGKGLRLRRAKITATQDAWMTGKLAQGDITAYDKIGDLVNDRAAADRYIDQVIQPRIRDLSGNGDTEIMDALRTGELGGQRIYKTPTKSWNTADLHEDAVTRAGEILSDGRGPQNRVIIRDPATPSRSYESLMKKGLDTVFHGLVDVPDRELNRIPAFNQIRWDETRKLLPYADAEGYSKVMSAAEDANLPADVMDALRKTTLDGSTSERLTYDQMNMLSKANTVDRIQNIVHDLTTRSQFFDMTRFLFPFGDAFRLIAKRWINTINEEPQLLERLRQGITEAKQPGSGAISRLFGDPVPHGEGFFHKDPNGEDVFALPGSTWFNTKLLGVPIPLNSHVAGLSMVGEGYPGLGGPTLTLPAKWFLPNTPTGDKIRNVIFPYGNGESQGIGTDIGTTFIPPWLQKVADGPIDQRARANSINAMLQALASTGNYDLQGPNAASETARLMQDAEQKSRLLYVIRGAAQFAVPGSPSPETMIKDPSGRTVIAQVVADRYRKHVHQDGPQAAMDWFIKSFGTNNIFVTQKASTAIGYAAPVTKDAQAWVDAHPGIRDKYPLTYGLFAPTGGTFDVSTYGEQFATGDRRPLTPREQIAQAENRLGFYIYNQAQQTLYDKNGGGPLNSAQHAILGQLRDALQKEYPGFDSFAAQPYDTAKRRAAAVDELTQAVKDPTIANTDTGQAVAQYLAVRDAAIAKAQSMGVKTPFTANRTLPLRTLLRTAADRLIADSPGFRSVWDNIFSRELAHDPGTS